MKKAVVMFCLFILPFAFVYSQTKVDTVQKDVDSACVRNLEDIFKVYDLKIKYDYPQFFLKDLAEKSYKQVSRMFTQFTDTHYIYIINDKVIQAMNILDFAINYPDEESCRKKFNELS